MQHDPVAQFESEVDALGRISRGMLRQHAGVDKAHSRGRKRGAGIARGVGQLRPPALVTRFGDAFPLAEVAMDSPLAARRSNISRHSSALHRWCRPPEILVSAIPASPRR